MLLEDVSYVFDEDGTRGAVLRIREVEGGEAGVADSLVEKRCGEVKAQFCEGDGVLE